MKLSTAPVSCTRLLETFADLFIEAIGDTSTSFTKVTSLELADPNSAIFINLAKSIEMALASPAKVIVIGKKDRSKLQDPPKNKTILVSPNVELAMARTLERFFFATPYTNSAITGVHSTAVVLPTAVLAEGVRVGPNAFIGNEVRIGARSYIGANAVIEDGSEIGEDTVIHPQVFVGHSCVIGSRCEINPQTVIGKEGFGYAHDAKGNHFRIPHVGRAIIEDDAHIGSSCTIDRGTFGDTRVAAGAKLDNQIHIAHNSVIGKNSIVTAGFTLAGSTKIGANFLAGGNSSVTGHIEIGDNVHLAGLSAVSKGIDKPGEYGGYPLQPLKEFLKTKAAIVQLPKMRKQLSMIMKHLGLEEDAET